MQNQPANDPTLSYATVRSDGALLVAWDTSVLLTIHSLQGAAPRTLLSFQDNQRVRAVAFVPLSDGGPTCVATAGDGKTVNLYRIWDNPPQSSSSSSSSSMSRSTAELVAHFGPHSKKIVSLSGSEGCLVFSDKFGCVYRINVRYNRNADAVEIAESVVVPEASSKAEAEEEGTKKDEANKKKQKGGADSDGSDNEGEEAAGAVFQLQHFSIITTMHLTLAHGKRKRLITCDRDGHVRVSNFPAVYDIEQYLWTEQPQAAVTALTELMPLPCEGAAFAMGDRSGRVTFWCGANAPVPKNEGNSFSRVAVVNVAGLLNLSTPTAPILSVVPMLPPASSSDNGAIAGGVFVSVDGCDRSLWIPIRVGGFSYEVLTEQAVPVSFPPTAAAPSDSPQGVCSPVAVMSLGTSTAIAILRSGRCLFLRMKGEQQVVPEFEEEFPVPLFEQHVSLWKSGLETLNVFGTWDFQTVDPRHRLGAGGATPSAVDENESGAKRPRSP